MLKNIAIKDTEAMDLIRHLRILIAVIRNKFRVHRTLGGTQKYWQKPDDGNNNPLQYVANGNLENPKAIERTRNLVDIVDNFDIKNPKILEIGCNAGRNLNGLLDAGYNNLNAIEISKDAIDVMQQAFPEAFSTANIQCGPAEDILSEYKDGEFDIVYTMAVLQHIHPDSIHHVSKEMVRICGKYLVIHEAETHSSWRHFPRSYRLLFSNAKARYIRRQAGARIFEVKN